MIIDRRLVAAATLACLIVGGCDNKAAEGNKATGEVLEGTISDAMIATDEVRSEPPLAPHAAKATDGKGEKAKGKAGGEAAPEEAASEEAAPVADTAPAPKPAASEPTP